MALIELGFAGLSAALAGNQQLVLNHIRNDLRLQLTNQFDFFLFRRLTTTDAISTAISGAGLGIDAYIAKVFVSRLELPSIGNLEIRKLDTYSFVEGINDLDDVSMELLETEEGLSVRYLQDWLDNIYTIETINENGFNYQRYVFNNSLATAKRDGEVFMKKKDGSPLQTYPAIKLEGLLLKDFTIPALDHAGTEISRITANFSVDRIKVVSSLFKNY